MHSKFELQPSKKYKQHSYTAPNVTYLHLELSDCSHSMLQTDLIITVSICLTTSVDCRNKRQITRTNYVTEC